ncbi:hypothetical protein FMEAI12_4570022 [Parafrankia sp. Ea1.12]|nr:hypothetical protein FMEAI12_4570022 [Parafrankia sp. Ea1.12]
MTGSTARALQRNGHPTYIAYTLPPEAVFGWPTRALDGQDRGALERGIPAAAAQPGPTRQAGPTRLASRSRAVDG